MTDRIEKVAGHTPDLVQAKIDAIARLFPNVVTEVENGSQGGVRQFAGPSTSTCCVRNYLTIS